ncbi:VOC family protein [Sphingomonas bacterium]|uniref:VOC family protein n=1 Tax=Sphingomonas bacterium TaxID=1895847 RepID=UPI001576460F|nr:VOC family protein [Sphingomonas bacterium]
MTRNTYIELPVASTGDAKAFYQAALGWTFADFGPSYASTMEGTGDMGLQADPAEKTTALLPVIEVADVAATLAAVESAGGTVTRPVFAFPGGQRFHFRDPNGHELAAMQPG